MIQLEPTSVRRNKLTQRDSAGYRLSPDGQPIVINIEVRSGVSQEQVTTAELFADYWSKVGIRAVVKAEERSLFETRKEAGEHDVMMQDASGGMYPLFQAHWYIPIQSTSIFAPFYGQWYQSGGRSGEEPPAEIKRLYDLYERALATSDSQERLALEREIMEINGENLWMIGTVSIPKNICIAKENLRNVPEVGAFTMAWPVSANPEQFFFQD